MEKVEKSPQKWLIFSNFTLKLLAFFFMTCDHVGIMLEYYYFDASSPFVIVLRALGRLAMPLFCFLIYEGVRHTHHFGKYALRLGIMATIIGVAMAILFYTNSSFSINLANIGNIFIDLLLGAVAVYTLKHPNKNIRLLTFIPLAYGIASFAVDVYCYQTGAAVYWFPEFLRTQYGWFGILLIITYQLAAYFKDYYLSNLAEKSGVDKEVLIDSSFDVTATSVTNMCATVFVCLLLYVCTWVIDMPYLTYQWVAIISGALVLCYNGKRGYNKKWFEYGAYLYYPLHLAIIALIFYLITL